MDSQDTKQDIHYIRERLDHVVDRLSEQDKVLARNTASLDYHILRTDQNEEMIEKLGEQMELALLPVKVARVFMWVGGIITFVWTLAYYWNQMRRP